MATLAQDLDADATDMVSLFSETFSWHDISYACVYNDRRNALIVQKSLFTGARYPKWGEMITVLGKVRQVVSVNGSVLATEDGRRVEMPPFVDRPDDPTLEIGFDVQLRA